jgi:hypothetical protein
MAPSAFEEWDKYYDKEMDKKNQRGWTPEEIQNMERINRLKPEFEKLGWLSREIAGYFLGLKEKRNAKSRGAT